MSSEIALDMMKNEFNKIKEIMEMVPEKGKLERFMEKQAKRLREAKEGEGLGAIKELVLIKILVDF